MTATLDPLLSGVQHVAVGTPIDTFAEADAELQRGRQLRLIKSAVPHFREKFAATGTPDLVSTYDLVSLPYLTKFGLFRAAITPAPYLTITNRMIIVQWKDESGASKTLLFEPTDAELGVNTPYFARLSARMPSAFQSVSVKVHGDVLTHLKTAGVAPEDVDYVVFDHLHTQDVRRVLGTTTPQADISPNAPVAPWFPNARMIVQSAELEAMADLHPLQRPWYQPETYADLRPESLLPIDGDVQLGPGVAILATPGHTIGNQSLVLNTSTGIWASSENVIATECLTPELSRIPGLAKWAHAWDQEVVINANTIEATAQQFNSCVKEKLIVDRSTKDARFLQFFPSSELTRSRLAPGASPTFTHGAITHRAR
jgi:glyoxylase-like metal-dependent hydrolase (beta-lactamase superfamily II)